MNKREQGFSSVYVILCLSALVLFLLCVCELCSGYAAGSMAENVCLTAGQSVLSEYQPDLQRRYGVFAVSSYEQKLTALSRFYIAENLNGANILVRPKLKGCEVSCEGFYGLDTEVLAQQIDSLGLLVLGEDILDETGALQLLKGLLDPVSNREDEDAADELANVPPSSEGGEGKKSAAELKKEYDDAMDPDLDLHEGKSLVSVQKDMLPTTILGIKPSSSLLKYTVSSLIQDGVSKDAILQARYITKVCSDFSREREDTVLGLETEYILFGRNSDKENEKEMKDALFKVRTAIDLARNLRNEEKMAGYAAAAAAFPAVPQPLAILLLAAIDAARQARGEVTVLCNGGVVPILPASTGLGSFGTYRDYATLLLLILPQQTRLARLMDIMQVNVAYMDGAAFSFRDYCYGYELRAEFEKQSFVPLLSGETRQGSVQQIHSYR